MSRNRNRNRVWASRPAGGLKVVFDPPDEDGTFVFGGVRYAEVGVAFIFKLSAPGLWTDGDDSLTWDIQGDLPEGWSLDDGYSAQAFLEGEPSEVAAPRELTVTATNPTTGKTATGKITVGTAEAAPVVDEQSLPNAAPEQEDYSQALTATGGTAPLVWSSADLPAWLTLDADGTLSSDEITDNEDTYTFTVRVTDAFGRYHERELSLTVAEVEPFHPDDDWLDAELYVLPESGDVDVATGAAVVANRGTVGGAFRQGTGSAQPGYTAEDANFNGKPSLDFDGSNDTMTLRNAANDANVPLSSVFTAGEGLILAVCRSDIAADATQRAILCEASQNMLLLFGNDADGPYYCRMWSGSYGNDAPIGGAAEVAHVVAAVKSPDPANTLGGRLDTATITAVAKTNMTSLTDAVVLGGISGAFFNGQVAMVVVMKTVPANLADRLARLVAHFNTGA